MTHEFISTKYPDMVTTIDGITAGDPYRVRIQRVATDGGNTLTVDAELITVEVRSGE